MNRATDGLSTFDTRSPARQPHDHNGMGGATPYPRAPHALSGRGSTKVVVPPLERWDHLRAGCGSCPPPSVMPVANASATLDKVERQPRWQQEKDQRKKCPRPPPPR